jgi:hypothetical protein
MLYTIDRSHYIDDIPYEADYRRWRSRLSDAEYNSIITELNERIDEGEIHTSSWMPGNNWAGTVYDPIYQKACDQNTAESAKCFGLFLWVVLQNHPDVWAFGRYEKNGVPIHGLTYFKLGKPPRR